MLKILLSLLLIGTAHAGQNFNKVMIIVFENTDYAQAVKQPYFASLMKEGAIATNYHALMHPSQPNYIALIGGSTFNVRNDDNVTINERHIGNLLEDSKKTWKVYAQDYPGNCFLGSRQGAYARKHVPFLSFQDVQTDPSKCANVQDASNFKNDFEAETLPTYSLYIPNLKNDGHDTNVSYGDKWLRENFGPIFTSPKLPEDLLIVITFDEGSRISDNRIYTLFLGGKVKKNFSTGISYDHYSLLRTIEEELSIGSLGRYDATAHPITDIWQ